MKPRTLISNLFLASARSVESVARALAAAGTGIGFTPKVTTDVQADVWDRFEAFLDRDLAFSGLMDWEKKVYRGYLPRSGLIGIVGCGAGREMIALGKDGLKFEGIDLSPAAIKKAREYLRQAHIKAAVSCGDICETDFIQKKYDAFVFSWFTYTYLPGSTRRVAVLQRLAKKLAKKGCIIISYIKDMKNEEAARFSTIAQTFARLSGSDYHPEPGDQFDMRMQFAHCFKKGEIEKEARSAGLKVIRFPDPEPATGVVILKRSKR